MLQDPETLLYFPICWQACLFGSRRPFDKKTDRFNPQDMQTFRKKYRTFANQFLVSPIKLDDITRNGLDYVLWDWSRARVTLSISTDGIGEL
jgi:hypothetical protein